MNLSIVDGSTDPCQYLYIASLALVYAFFKYYFVLGTRGSGR